MFYIENCFNEETKRIKGNIFKIQIRIINYEVLGGTD